MKSFALAAAAFRKVEVLVLTKATSIVRSAGGA
jgi:hypothetical protein